MQKQSHSIAFVEAQISKGICGTVRIGIQLGIGKPFAIARIIDRLELGIAVSPPGQKLADVLVHTESLRQIAGCQNPV